MELSKTTALDGLGGNSRVLVMIVSPETTNVLVVVAMVVSRKDRRDDDAVGEVGVGNNSLLEEEEEVDLLLLLHEEGLLWRWCAPSWCCENAMTPPGCCKQKSRNAIVRANMFLCL